MEQLRQQYRREVRDVCGYLEEALWDLGKWKEKAAKVAEAYRRSNGQMTDELREAIEELIAKLQPEVNDDAI
jgi:hypothetical protein